MKIAYFDCFAGISGDMLLGALVDLGLSPDTLKQELQSLGLSGYEITAQRVTRRGISGMKVDVTVTGDQPHRHLKDILQILEHSRLSETVKQDAKNIFTLLAQAEGKIHNKAPESVHFHEVGAVDSIVDIVGTLIGLQKLKVEQVYCSPLNVGSGTVHCAHGVMPVPAPATAEILVDTPIYSAGPAVELVTPTGAVLVKYLAKGFGPMPGMLLKAVGYGAGDRETQIPNLLRVMLGEKEPHQHLYRPWQGQMTHREHGHCHQHEHKHA
ncbi:nickel pincer cofactor biosynthesis protein LarC [Desulforamulus ferrireducens]|uniref:TIGR00299 family protein n=1 Tax=Desulforamulus ferrireducens TaxID=1833852 RepID=A0A1S6IT14_9FIRM|nr:nickel pincer cofactor biosynthesis protein LarC [Desulforamulus ferrireducens]AQS57906.1 TIGR00299 family protein [Desulforamulus ferrireducens]